MSEVIWSKASKEVLTIAQAIIEEHLPDLQEVNIGFLFRSEAPITNGKATYGKTRKVSADLKVYIDNDFLIWLAEDTWNSFSPHQKKALVHHELLHCGVKIKEDSDVVTPYMISHDIEEFLVIWQLYGFWEPGDDRTEVSAQMALDLPTTRLKRMGRVELVDPQTLSFNLA